MPLLQEQQFLWTWKNVHKMPDITSTLQLVQGWILTNATAGAVTLLNCGNTDDRKTYRAFGVGVVWFVHFFSNLLDAPFFKLSVSLNTKMYLFFGLFLCITIIHNTWKYSKKCSDSAQTLFKKNTITWQFPSFLCGITPDGKWGLGRANFARLWVFWK